MSDTVEVKISGLDELQVQLKALPKKVANKILRETLKEAGEDLREKMVDEAPKRTGFLKEHFNIKVSIKRKDVAGSVMVGPAAKVYYPGGTEMRDAKGRRLVATGQHAVAGAQVPVTSVARFTEFGTNHEAADPFMTRSFEMLKSALLDKIIDGIKDALDE